MGRFDSFLTSLERAGFKAANFTHKVVVSGLIIGSAYGFYTIVRDYRAYFLMRKDPRYQEYIQQRNTAIREMMAKNEDSPK